MRVDTRAHGGSAQSDLREFLLRVTKTNDGPRDLAGVPLKFLAQPDRCRVL
jgi:hypothetical protein